MKNYFYIISILISIFYASSIEAQIKFKDGFYIDNSGNRVEGLIRDVDWKSNPKTFEFKISEDSKIEIATIANVEMFQIENHVKYVRKTVDMDRWDIFSPVTVQRHPIYQSETLFLKELVNGGAVLYLFTDESFTTFFYNVNESKPKQLIRKEYIVENQLGYKTRYTNYLYKRQLLADLKCDNISEKDANNLNYYESDLVKFFKKFNECKGESSDLAVTKKLKMHISIKAGIVQNSFDIKYQSDNRYDFDFGSKTQIRLGLDAEVVLPFNKNKWALFAEPVYTSFKEKGDGTIFTSDVDYKAIEAHFGLRHYMFINSQAKVFLNAGAVFAFSINGAEYDAKRYNYSFPYIVEPQLLLGAGYKYKKVSAEVRYINTQNLIVRQIDWDSNYTSLAFVVGYEIF